MLKRESAPILRMDPSGVVEGRVKSSDDSPPCSPPRHQLDLALPNADLEVPLLRGLNGDASPSERCEGIAMPPKTLAINASDHRHSYSVESGVILVRLRF